MVIITISGFLVSMDLKYDVQKESLEIRNSITLAPLLMLNTCVTMQRPSVCC